jgi:hypothetical protein
MSVEHFTAVGHLNGMAKLTPEQVTDIRRRYARRAEKGRKVTIAQLAREYGITTTHCTRILHYESWQHVA